MDGAIGHGPFSVAARLLPLAIFLMLLTSPAIAAVHHTLGMLNLMSSLATHGSTYRDSRDLYESGAQDHCVESAVSYLKAASAHYAANSVLQWSLGRALLLAKDGPAAHRVLQPLDSRSSTGPLLYLDVLSAAYHAGAWESVIALYQRHGQPTERYAPLLTSIVAHAYLEHAFTVQGNARQAALLTSYSLAPAGLAVNYALWQSLSPGDESRDLYLDRVLRFPVDAIALEDPLQQRRLIATIRELVRDGIWDHDRMQSAVTFLIWQYGTMPDLAELLQQMAKDAPTASVWRHMLGELYLRRGEPALAISLYEALHAENPDDASALLGFALAWELFARESNEPDNQRIRLATATALYEAYRLRRPGDLVATQRLSDVYSRLDDPRQTEMLTELAECTDARRMISELLHVRPEDVQLGPNLASDGDFQAVGTLSAWKWSVAANREPWANGAFGGGADTLWVPSARVLGLWTDEPTDGQERARAGYWQEMQVPGPGLYWLSFWYQTDSAEASQADVWISIDPQNRTATKLPSTDGEWRCAGMPLGAFAEEMPRILLRNWGVGSVRFAHMQLNHLEVIGVEGTEIALPKLVVGCTP